MISPIKLLCTFNGNDISNILYHANHFLLTHRVATNITKRRIAYVMAAITKLQFRPHLLHRITQQGRIFFWLPYQVQYQSQRRLSTNARKLCKLIDRFFYERGGKNHDASYEL